MNKRFAMTALAGVLGAMMLAGCGTKAIKPDDRKPAKLIPISAPMTVLTPVFSTKLEQGGSIIKRGKHHGKDVVDLQIAPTADGLIAASRGGSVTRFVGNSPAWSVNLKQPITSAAAIGGDELVVVGARSGNIIALNAKTGETLWQTALPSASLAPALITGNRVIVSTNSNVVYGLDASNGAIAWQYSIQAPTVTVRGMAKPWQLDARTALVGGADGRVHALDIASGTPVWMGRVGLASGTGDVAKLRDVDGVPTMAGDILYVASYGGQLMGFDMRQGQPIFASKLASTGSVAALGSLVIGANIDGEVIGFNRLTGEQVWQNDELKFRGLTNAVTVGQYVAIGDKDGVIHLFDETGKIVSRLNTKQPLTSLQVHQNRLYAQSTNGVANVWQF
ncbi:PQQ-binding-like beta-propeller repeat protein [Moraxella nasicaprae]|uniref:Outer membrane protein assembly factor BamB n=1 Tax=Moraxella nasicaprae TaxID=2904122 RepID=A0ABY6F360_9GAMM|nr:PQQ-binding-like beta-propeller repeat protein [Moraxella nasicaprae]UXZ04533.1 PQQ-binding-like beta-propeller repeat protein [Moraxella nasicaprae]